MTTEPALYGTLAFLAAALITAIVTDVRSRIIPNKLVGAIALAAPLFWWASGLSLWPGLPVQLLTATVIFGVFLMFFQFGIMGGGDVKLMAVLGLWLPWQAMYDVVLFSSLIGVLVTVIFLVEHKALKRLGKPKIPFGIAIAMASLGVVGERYFNLFP